MGKGRKRKIPYQHRERFKGGSIENDKNIGANKNELGERIEKGKEDRIREYQGKNSNRFIPKVKVGC